MIKQIEGKINWLERNLPEGLLVDAAWLTKHGYSTALRTHYVATGWLEQPVRRVYRRPRGSSLAWQQVVISLQALLKYPLLVGGRAALEVQGFAHYLSHATRDVYLYGPKPPPRWLYNLPLDTRFLWRNAKLFRRDAETLGVSSLSSNDQTKQTNADDTQGVTSQRWGQWDWPLMLSTPERAILELLDELPAHETFHQVDMLMEGLANLSPRKLEQLLADCRSVKVKRLFFFFADRHHHAWSKHLNRDAIDLGRGKRMLVKGGTLDSKYQITVPEDLSGLR
jgi:transcriptional regulator with AbiEi antitoxin domain of type IV toxin-antitoxin system